MNFFKNLGILSLKKKDYVINTKKNIYGQIASDIDNDNNYIVKYVSKDSINNKLKYYDQKTLKDDLKQVTKDEYMKIINILNNPDRGYGEKYLKYKLKYINLKSI